MDGVVTNFYGGGKVIRVRAEVGAFSLLRRLDRNVPGGSGLTSILLFRLSNESVKL